MGFSISFRSMSTEFTAPLEPNTLNAMENTSTQLMKLGSVVTVCTNFW